VDLSRFAQPGVSIQVRFELATNCGSGSFGWYIDDVMVYRCHP
jgi:hypothetical protein